MEFIFGAYEREYWLEQLDRLMLMKIRLDHGIGIESYSLCENPEDIGNDLREIFADTLQLVLESSPIQVKDLTEYDSDNSVIMSLYFPFASNLSSDDGKLVDEAKIQIKRCFDHLNFDAFSDWGIENPNEIKVTFEYSNGVGMVLKYFLKTLEDIKHLLERKDLFDHYNRVESN